MRTVALITFCLFYITATVTANSMSRFKYQSDHRYTRTGILDKQLKLFKGSYSAEGYIDHDFPKQGISYHDPSDIHVLESAKSVYWNQTWFTFWVLENASYMLIPSSPGLCYVHDTYTFDTMNEEYSYALTYESESSPIKNYIGNVLDLGSCCDTVAVDISMLFEKILSFRYSQYYPSFASAFFTDVVRDVVVVGENRFTKFGKVNTSKFDLPPECKNPATMIPYCPALYQAWGWCIEGNNLAVPYNTTVPTPP